MREAKRTQAMKHINNVNLRSKAHKLLAIQIWEESGKPLGLDVDILVVLLAYEDALDAVQAGQRFARERGASGGGVVLRGGEVADVAGAALFAAFQQHVDHL